MSNTVTERDGDTYICGDCGDELATPPTANGYVHENDGTRQCVGRRDAVARHPEKFPGEHYIGRLVGRQLTFGDDGPVVVRHVILAECICRKVVFTAIAKDSAIAQHHIDRKLSGHNQAGREGRD